MKKKNIKSQAVVSYKTPSKKNYELIKKLKKEVNLIKRGTEYKVLHVDVTNSQIPSATGYVVELMSAIVQGTNIITRIGNRINVHSIQFEWTANVSSTTTTGAGAVDFFIDKKPDGTALTIFDFFQTADPYSLTLFLYRQRFKHLYHKQFQYGTFASDSMGSNGQFYKKVNFITIYTGNVGNVTDFVGGFNDALITFRSTNSGAGSNSYGIKCNIKIIFTDS